MLTDTLFHLSVAGFVAGIFVRSFVDLGAGFSLFLLLLGGTLLLVARAPRAARAPSVPPTPPASSGASPRRAAGGVAFLAIFFLAAGAGALRFEYADRAGPRAALAPLVGERVSLEGIVADEPDERETHARLTVRVRRAAEGDERYAGAKILVVVPREPRYRYGDALALTGELARPDNFIDEETLREVNYRAFLAKDGIYYEMFLPRAERTARGEGQWALEKLFAFKEAFVARLNALIPQPQSALLAGLVVGAKQSLGKKLLDDFRAVGVIHIVVLSGYNITIVARFIEWLCSSLARRRRLVLSALAIVLFAAAVGASATVVRASIMALLVVLARATGRIYAVTRALLIAGFIMLLHNPKILVFDASFQLSFLATVGLIYLSPMIEPRVRWVTERWGFREIVVATIATQVFVLPFLLYKTGVLSLVSLPANLLILTAIPATMLFGFLAGLAGLAGLVGAALAFPFAYAAYAFLSYELGVVEWFARLPVASVTLVSFPLWAAALCYGMYALILWRCKAREAPVSLSEKESSGLGK